MIGNYCYYYFCTLKYKAMKLDLVFKTHFHWILYLSLLCSIRLNRTNYLVLDSISCISLKKKNVELDYLAN